MSLRNPRDDITPAATDQGSPFRIVQCWSLAFALFLGLDKASRHFLTLPTLRYVRPTAGIMMRVMRRLYEGRRAVSIENDRIRVTVLEGGGHIAEILDKATGVNPLWTPPWPSIEPGDFDHATHPGYGSGPAESRLLSAIMGHNLCLDIFGGPSPEEAAAGFPVHGETSVARFAIETSGPGARMHAVLPSAQLRVERQLRLDDRAVAIRESVENLSATDRAVGWTQHVTIGPPFLEKGRTEFRLSADRSMVFPGTFGPADYLQPGAPFDWPHAPRAGGGVEDLRRYTGARSSSAYTAQRMDVSLSLIHI